MQGQMCPDDELARRWIRFFACVNTLHAESANGVLRRLVAARRYLDENLDESVDLDTVARRAHFSKFHFLRTFKVAFNETPLRYLQRRRLETAKRLLLQTDLPVTNICFRVGYESLGSFSTLFRRFAGASPYTYRRRYVTVPRTIAPAERLIPDCWLRRYGLAAVSWPSFSPTEQF